MGIIDTIKDFMSGGIADQASGMTDGLQDQATEGLGDLGDTVSGLADQLDSLGDSFSGDEEQQ
jgi:hypothetical protein